MPIFVKQIRSASKCTKQQKETLNALGLGAVHSIAVRKDSHAIRGMLNKVHHLIQADLVEEGFEPEKQEKKASSGYRLG